MVHSTMCHTSSEKIFTTSSWDLPSVTTTAMRFLTWLARCDVEKTWSTANLMALPVYKTDVFNFRTAQCHASYNFHQKCVMSKDMLRQMQVIDNSQKRNLKAELEWA